MSCSLMQRWKVPVDVAIAKQELWWINEDFFYSLYLAFLFCFLYSCLTLISPPLPGFSSISISPSFPIVLYQLQGGSLLVKTSIVLPADDVFEKHITVAKIKETTVKWSRYSVIEMVSLSSCWDAVIDDEMSILSDCCIVGASKNIFHAPHCKDILSHLMRASKERQGSKFNFIGVKYYVKLACGKQQTGRTTQARSVK